MNIGPPAGPTHLGMLTAERESASEPGSPLPLLNVPLAVADWHGVTVPVLVSVKVNWVDPA